MAKTKDSKEENVDISKNLLGSLMNGYKETHFNNIDVKPVKISSGSLLLDQFISCKSNSVVRLGGAGAELGKTSQCMLFAMNYMQTMPKSKTIYINAEARLTDEFKARTGLTYTENPDNWEYGTVFVLNSNIMETFCSIVESLLKIMKEHEEHLCIILDSIDMVRLQSNLDKAFGSTTKLAGVQFLTKELFRRLGFLINRYNSLFMITSQYSSQINATAYGPGEPPKQMSGSAPSSLSHQCDYALYYRPRYQGDLILENPDEKPDIKKNKVLGVYATIELKKSATDNTNCGVIKIPIKKGRIGNCVWQEKEIVDVGLALGFFNKKGAWIDTESSLLEEARKDGLEIKDKFQGLNNIYSYMEENKSIFEWLYKKFSALNSN